MPGEGKGKGSGAKPKSGAKAQKRRPNREAARGRADRQLAQGMGKAVKQAFGKTRRSALLRCWDAFDSSHLPLPRSTGPYTVVRTTQYFTTAAKYVQFGTFQHTVPAPEGAQAREWSNICAIASETESNPINAANNTRAYSVPFPGVYVTGSTFSCVPSAISVQLMNSNALQTTDGLVFGAVCGTQLDFNGRTETYNEISSEVVSYFRPRLMSAAKLSLRGIHANSYPLNMSELANFKQLRKNTANPTGTAATLDGTQIMPVGFAPIVFINQDSPENRTQYTFLVCVEWRVRFDIGNPAVASHTHHAASTDREWDTAIRQAVSLGHGMVDIVETVASAGEAVSRLRSLM